MANVTKPMEGREKVMNIDVSLWGHRMYGGAPIDEISISGTNLFIRSKDASLVYYAGTDNGIIDFKNKVLWAYEEYLRDKRSSG